MVSRNALRITALTLTLLGLAACTDDSLGSAAGHYEGFLISTASGARTQSSVGADVTAVSSSELSVKIRPEPQGDESDFDVVVSDSNVQVSSAQVAGAGGINLSLQKSDGNCYADSSKANQVCFDGTELSIGLTLSSTLNVQYLLDRQDPSGTSPTTALEKPKVYSMDELLALAQSRNFQTRAQFESVIQAKLTAQNAYLNLLPHVNVGSALDLVGFVTLTMVHAVGDFLPFILPDRWFQAAADDDTANSQFDSYRVLQANSINVVQGLALSVLRDEETLEALQQNRVEIANVRDGVLAAEHAGTVEAGSSDDVTSVLTTTIMTIEALRETITEEQDALAQATGFVNPAAVAGVRPIEIPQIEAGIAGAEADFETMSVKRSLELLQSDDLVAAAQETKKASYWQWLDPTGADAGSIGFGLPDYIQINDSTIDQLNVQKQGTEATLRGLVATAYNQSSQLASRYQLAIQESQSAENRITRIMANFHSGILFAMADLVSALHDKAQGDTDQINAQYAYLTVLAQMDRQTLSGPYAPLYNEKWPPQPK